MNNIETTPEAQLSHITYRLREALRGSARAYNVTLEQRARDVGARCLTVNRVLNGQTWPSPKHVEAIEAMIEDADWPADKIRAVLEEAYATKEAQAARAKVRARYLPTKAANAARRAEQKQARWGAQEQTKARAALAHARRELDDRRRELAAAQTLVGRAEERLRALGLDPAAPTE